MRTILGLLVVLASVALRAEAEQAPMPPETRQAYATHILTGKVGPTCGYGRPRQHGNHNYVQYVAEVTVDVAEEGEGPKRGDLVYVRYWTKGWAGPGYPSPGGGGRRDILPREGESPRFFNAVGKGEDVHGATGKGYEVASPKGFGRLTPTR